MTNGYDGYSQMSNNFGLNQQNFGQNNFRSTPPYNQGYNNQEQLSEIKILKGRPVSSIEEARALSVDLDGSITYFPDRTNKRIYAKYFNPDGSASFEVYVRDDSAENKTKYVTQQELSEAMMNMRNMLMSYAAGGMTTIAGNSNINNGAQSSKLDPSANQSNDINSRQSFNI